MPMLDVTIPKGALCPEAESKLMSRLTTILLRNEGADPENQRVQSLAWVFLHRPEAIFVAGERAELPYYRVVASVPEGQWTPERRAQMVEDVTEAILDAEGGTHKRDPFRVWVFPQEIPEGSWGANGEIVGLGEIAGFALGDAEAGQAYADGVFATRRNRERARLGLSVARTLETAG